MNVRYFIDNEPIKSKALYPLTYAGFMAHFFTYLFCVERY
jgi:hypothetical protein